MAKKSKSPFRSGHKHIKQEDAFTRTVQKVYQYYVKNTFQAIITTLAGLGILVVAVILISRWTGADSKAPPKEAALSLLIAQQLVEVSPAEAEDTLRNLIARYPRTQPGKKAHYYLGQALFMQGNFEEALTEFTEFEKSYPVKKSFLRPAALFAQGNCLEELNRLEEAIERYSQLPDKYSESAFIPFAKIGTGRCMIILKQFDQAEEIFTQMLDDYPSSNYQVIYWTAQNHLGRIDALRNMF
jgi:tetratricopeptide (TPR) repeat protein